MQIIEILLVIDPPVSVASCSPELAHPISNSIQCNIAFNACFPNPIGHFGHLAQVTNNLKIEKVTKNDGKIKILCRKQ